MEPWGTPVTIGRVSDLVSFTSTNCLRSKPTVYVQNINDIHCSMYRCLQLNKILKISAKVGVPTTRRWLLYFSVWDLLPPVAWKQIQWIGETFPKPSKPPSLLTDCPALFPCFTALSQFFEQFLSSIIF